MDDTVPSKWVEHSHGLKIFQIYAALSCSVFRPHTSADHILCLEQQLRIYSWLIISMGLFCNATCLFFTGRSIVEHDDQGAIWTRSELISRLLLTRLVLYSMNENVCSSLHSDVNQHCMAVFWLLVFVFALSNCLLRFLYVQGRYH